jgi:hypothetical protein
MSVLSRLLAILVFALMNVVLNGVLPAGVIIGNLPGDDGSGESFNQTSSMSIGVTIAASDVTLTGVTLRLQATNSSEVVKLAIDHDLLGNPGPSPLAVLGTRTVSSGSFSDYVFTPVSQTVLLANTTYWLTISKTIANNDQLTLSVNSMVSIPTGDHANYFGLRFYDGFSVRDLGPSPVPSFQMDGVVNSVAVSEPPYLPLIILVGGAMFLLRRATSSGALSGTDSVA